jgi:hypothetical protein
MAAYPKKCTLHEKTAWMNEINKSIEDYKQKHPDAKGRALGKQFFGKY